MGITEAIYVQSLNLAGWTIDLHTGAAYLAVFIFFLIVYGLVVYSVVYLAYSPTRFYFTDRQVVVKRGYLRGLMAGLVFVPRVLGFQYFKYMSYENISHVKHRHGPLLRILGINRLVFYASNTNEFIYLISTGVWRYRNFTYCDGLSEEMVEQITLTVRPYLKSTTIQRA